MSTQEFKNITISPWAWSLPLLPLGIFGFDTWHSYDQSWFLSINHLTSQLPDMIWTSLSLLGNGWSLFALIFPFMLFVRKPFYAAIISGALTGVLSHVAKQLANTSRPAGVLDQSTFHIIDNPLLHSAMPSGHTMTAFSIATAIFFSLPNNNRNRWAFIFLLALGVGISRMAVGAHWPQDVLVGSALGIISGLIGAILIEKVPEHLFSISAWPFKIVSLASAISLYILITDTLDFQLNKPVQMLLAALILITWAKLLLNYFHHPEQ